MKKLMLAACVAALAMGAKASKSYGIDTAVYITPYKLDPDPGNSQDKYSFYFMKVEDAKTLMNTTSEDVSYSEMADWLGKNFTANMASFIENAESIVFSSYNKMYRCYSATQNGKVLDSQTIGGDFGVCLYSDDGSSYDVYCVIQNEKTTKFLFDDSTDFKTDWIAVSSVPEPTSGLLLLVGGALLALKRKRA